MFVRLYACVYVCMSVCLYFDKQLLGYRATVGKGENDKGTKQKKANGRPHRFNFASYSEQGESLLLLLIVAAPIGHQRW